MRRVIRVVVLDSRTLYMDSIFKCTLSMWLSYRKLNRYIAWLTEGKAEYIIPLILWRRMNASVCY